MGVPADAERRLVTVLFADLVGHTEAASRVDPEEWRVILQAYFAELRRPIERYGGTVEKFIGDAIFAVFGVPRTHEDDAERAVRAAVEMQAALARLNPGLQRRLGVPLQMRIGIATGEAVAPGAPHTDALVTGDLTALAERLQGISPVGSVALSERTLALVRASVEAEPLEDRQLKGFPGLRPVFLVRRILPETAPVAPAIRAPLVNREGEVRELTEVRDALLAGQGRIVFILGDAGLGKSRLILELRDRLDPQVPVLLARCHEFTQTTPYGVVVQHLRGYLELTGEDPPEVARLQLGAALQGLFGSPTPDPRPALEHLLGLETGRIFEEQTQGLSPEDVRETVLRAITSFWERAAQRPHVLLVEDLHWVDAASADALERFFEISEHAPLLLLFALRPERRSLAWELRVAAERDYPHRHRELRLGPLSPADTEHLAGALLEQLALPPDLKAPVARRAEGNPFYVEEVVRSIEQRGTPAAIERLPDTLQGVLQARLDALSPQTRRVLQVAAVIGREFPLDLLQVVSGSNGELLRHLSALQRTDFIQEVQRLPRPVFAFKHVLLQEAAYQILLREEQRAMHRRLAQVLEREAPPVGPHLPVLFHHFRQGEVWEKAVEYGERAAAWARELGADEEAVGDYRQVVAILETHPEAAPPDVQRRVREAFGDLLVEIGLFDDARAQYQLLKGPAATAALQAHAERKMAAAYRREGALDRAREHLQQALQLLRPGEDASEEAWAHLDLGYVEDQIGGDPQAVLAHCERAKELAAGGDPVLNARVFRLFTLAYGRLGDMDSAEATGRRAVEFAQQGGEPLEVAINHNNLAWAYVNKGETARALAHVQQGLAAASAVPPRRAAYQLAIIHMTRGEIHLARGEWVEAQQALEEARRVLADIGPFPRIRLEMLCLLAQAFVEQDQVASALPLLDEAGELCATYPLHRLIPLLQRVRAEVYLRDRDLERAEEACREGLEAARRYRSEVERPALLRVRARIAAEHGELEDALRWLTEAAGLLARQGKPPELGRVWLEQGKIYMIRREQRKAAGVLRRAREQFQRLGARTFVEHIDRLLDLIR